MNRPQSRWQIRKSAARAFEKRNRMGVDRLRQPNLGETPLSEAEILYAVRLGIISDHPAPARSTEGAVAP